MAAIKDAFSPALVAALADELRRAWPGFDGDAFTADGVDGLAELELKGRMLHLTGALDRHLPPGFADLEPVIRGALASPSFDGWMTVPGDLPDRRARDRRAGRGPAAAGRHDRALHQRVGRAPVHRPRSGHGLRVVPPLDRPPRRRRPPPRLGGLPAPAALGAAGARPGRGPESGGRHPGAPGGRPVRVRAPLGGQQPQRHRPGPPRAWRSRSPPAGARATTRGWRGWCAAACARWRPPAIATALGILGYDGAAPVALEGLVVTPPTRRSATPPRSPSGCARIAPRRWWSTTWSTTRAPTACGRRGPSRWRGARWRPARRRRSAAGTRSRSARCGASTPDLTGWRSRSTAASSVAWTSTSAAPAE